MLTVSLILATTALFSLAMLLVLGSLMRSPVPGVREWFGANLGMVISLPLLALRGTIPDFISIVVANVVLAIAGALYYAGCARFLQRPLCRVWLLAGIALVGAAMIIWRYVYVSLPMRVIASTMYNCLICMAIGVIMLRHRPAGRSPYHFCFAAVLAFLFAATQVLRGVAFIGVPESASIGALSTPWNIFLLTIGAVIMPTLTMIAVMMVHEHIMASVEHSLNHDHLTGALSRKRFEDVSLQMLSEAQSTKPVALLLIDLDHFKRINDTFGHAGGDAVLRAFVNLIMRFKRGSDALGRLGGEEFGLLLPGTTMQEAAALAELLRTQAEQHVVAGAFGECRYCISIGIAVAVGGETADRLSVRADRALYHAKNGGRNRVFFHETDTTHEIDTAAAAGSNTGTGAVPA